MVYTATKALLYGSTYLTPDFDTRIRSGSARIVQSCGLPSFTINTV